MQDFRDSFYLIDIEKSGHIVAGDLRDLLLSLQNENGESNVFPHLRKLLTELESLPENATLDLEDYIALMAKTSLHQTMQQEDGTNFAHVFQLFDLDGKGYIEIGDLERIAVELGEFDITREELEEMIFRAQTNRQGRVYLNDFARIMNLNLFQKSDAVHA